ncbi:MAG TPA: cohesin domain-containing protein [Longimicrobium sp.]|nr:cohesin domain-containing protein [Longimicrobium sp.]
MKHAAWKRGAAALLVSAALAACERQPAASQTPDPLGGLEPGIHPVLVVAAAEGGAQVELHLRRVQVQGRVASYQGELRYDASVLRLRGAQLPAGVAGAWNEVEPGRVRFAGAAPGGVPDGAVLTLRFAASAPPVRESFAVAMEEVVAHDFADLTASVSRAEHPVFSTAPLAVEQ